MRESQKCQKCGRSFTRIDRTGPYIEGMGDIMRRVKEKTCPGCGGRVIWVDENGTPMNTYKSIEESNKHFRLGCLWGVVALVGFILFHYFFVIR
jgi:DNA-directed RNA polymerase subunit RPC12/RpoP